MKVVTALLGLLVFALAGGAAFVWSGLYDVSATDQHLAPTYWLLRKTMHRSVAERAEEIAVPPLGAPKQLERGLALFRTHCVQCHGAPGVAPEPFALALRPLPTPLVRTGRDQTPAYIFWVVKRGIKMTGMPAWEFRMNEEDIWAIVAFTRELAKLSPAQYQAARAEPIGRREEPALGAPDRRRGRQALEQYACIACHEIPGLTGPEARVGPTLHGIGSRQIIAGILPNSPENMTRWLLSPKAVTPLTAMPDLGLTERDARDITAHLATLK
jgi:mono/diheme cytochrome c family protein